MKHAEKFLADNVFPKCFECNQDNPDKLEKCAFCGADLKIKLLDESTPNGILSFNNLQTEKPAKISLAIISYAGSVLTLLYLSMSFNFIVFIYYGLMKGDIDNYDKDFTSYLKAKNDVNDGNIKYLIPRPGGYSESDSGKKLNGVPVYYKHYDADSKDFGRFGITLQESDKTLAINHAISYNKYISRVINHKDFIKRHKNSMVMLTEPCSCDQHKAVVRIFPEFYFGQQVKVKSRGQRDFQGKICGIETDEAGRITYSVQLDSQNVRREIPEDNIAVLRKE
ncbi:MAG: hypothetical protein WC071_11265 [Victivallaceae bacterium]